MIKKLALIDTVELQWLEHFWDYEIVFETRVVRAIEGYYRAMSEGLTGISWRF